jgi:hypothetical protein
MHSKKNTWTKKTILIALVHVSFSNAEGAAVSSSALGRELRRGPAPIASPQGIGLEDMLILSQ